MPALPHMLDVVSAARRGDFARVETPPQAAGEALPAEPDTMVVFPYLDSTIVLGGLHHQANPSAEEGGYDNGFVVVDETLPEPPPVPDADREA